MSHEHYKDLIQAQSLDNEIFKHLEVIKGNNQRVEFIEKQRKDKQDDLQSTKERLSDLQHKNSELEKELAEVEGKIAKSNEHIALATTSQQADAINKELETLKPKASELEDTLLQLIDEMDNSSQSIEEYEKFLKGSQETLEEIKKEVETSNKSEEEEIKKLEERIKNLLSLVPTNFKDAFLESQKEHRFHNPIAFIQDRCCNQCRFAIDITIQESVQHGNNPERCPSCSRLVLPLSATNVTG